MSSTPLSHAALFYASEADYVESVRAFAHAGLAAGGAVLIAVPEPGLTLLRPALDDFGERAEFADMAVWGRNPSRIMAFMQAFIDSHPGVPLRVVGEPIWSGRTPQEITEGVRHEALINQALAGSPVSILCPYNERALDAGALADARRTHPTLLLDGEERPSSGYVDPLLTYAATERPLPEPGGEPVPIPVARDLGRFRALVAAEARSSGMGAERATALVLAANEAAANTLVHAGGAGSARIWREEAELVFELRDRGEIRDPLAGRRAPPPEQEGGRGLWLINQLCDLVELRSGRGGTVVRLHMRLSG